MARESVPRHSRGCSAWHPDRMSQRGVFADDLAELVPVGELVPMEFKTFGGRRLVLIAFAEGKAARRPWLATLRT
jgi:hypothetical protein